ncbi:MAG: hypothetical protein Q8Q13_02740 [bacterium]|nr:hypothetical protein [bacterium]
MSFGTFPQNKESLPSVLLRPQETFSSKISPIFHSDVRDATTGKEIGYVDFQLNHAKKTITVTDVKMKVNKQGQGYGVSLYRFLQSKYPEYQLQSSDQMSEKRDVSQEKPNAVKLWEKLLRLGDAEEDGKDGFRMKK